MAATSEANNTSNNTSSDSSKRPGNPHMTISDFSRPVNLQRIAQKKEQVKSYTRRKKLEKLGVYSSCKAEESCKCNGWKNPNPPPTPTRLDLSQPLASLTDPCRSCNHPLGSHISHLQSIEENELDRLLCMVVDVENLFMCVHKEEDPDTKQVYFYLFKLLRKCILQMSKPTVESSLGTPPFEKPSIAKAVLNFVLHKFGHLPQREWQIMHDLAKMFLHCLNHWKLETVSMKKQHSQGEQIAAYKINYTRWLCYCHVPVFCDSIPKHDTTTVFGRTLLRSVFSVMRRQLLEKFRAEKDKMPADKRTIVLTLFPRFLSMLEDEVYRENSPIWDIDFVVPQSISLNRSSLSLSPLVSFTSLTDSSTTTSLSTSSSPTTEEISGIKRAHKDDEAGTPGKKSKLAVPAEIIARGPEAEEAFQKALEEGKVQVYRGRIMLIGQDRAGKTSLKKSLLGLKFDPKEPSTDGVDVHPSSFSITTDNVTDWELSNDDPINTFEEGIAKIMAEILNNEREKAHETAVPVLTEESKHQEVYDHDWQLEEDDEEKCTDETNKIRISDQGSNNEREAPSSPQTAAERDSMTEEVIRKLVKCLSEKSINPSDEETDVSIWDFAGQHLYYASHPVFFSPRAVYILVYNLEKNLKAKAVPLVRQGVHDIILDNYGEQTNLEAMKEWLVSVHSARPENPGDNLGDLPYLRPPVVIVGTHADCPFEEPKKMEEIIQKSITGNTYDQHVVRPFITVNNTLSSDDDGVRKLRNKIQELFEKEPYMGEKVPVRWFKFEQLIKSLVEEENKYHLPLKETEKLIAKVCHIKDQKETTTLLNFYNDLGVIVKHGTTVVLKAEWLIDLFRKLITIRPFNEQNPVHSAHWTTLEKTGILHMALVDHVFKETIASGETKEDIIAMMEHYGLIARYREAENQEDFHYFVPAQLKSSPEGLVDVEPSTTDPCVLYLHFLDGFIPHGLYNCLVSKLITWCSGKEYPNEPNLYTSVSHFFIGRTYQYELILVCKKRFVKVVLRSRQKERSWVFQPVPFKVRVFLENSLNDITIKYHWYRFSRYEISVLCPSCSRPEIKCHKHGLESCCDDDCLHLLPIPNDRVMVCRKSFGDRSKPDVHGLEEWYREHPRVPMHSEKLEECVGGVSVATTFNMSDNQKRWLVMGICLNKTLLQKLRDFLGPKMLDLYCHLKTNKNIDKQIYPGQLTKDGKCNSLNYGSINNNEANHRKKAASYDYKVISAVDLGKLYLQPFMAKFSGFDDTCDLSGVLGILSSASVFTPDVQDLSSQVRKDVRNEWGHCNFLNWDETKFTSCFTLINSLVKALNLPSTEEKKIIDELREWEKKGVQLCMGTIAVTDLVKFVDLCDVEIEQLSREVKLLESYQKDEASRVRNALGSLRKDFEKYRESINKKVDRLERMFEYHETVINALELAIQPK